MDNTFAHIKSTPARRAKVAEIKEMIAQAGRFLEKEDLEAYAELVADIRIEVAKIDPRDTDKIFQAAEQSAEFCRSMSEPPKSPLVDWQKDRFIFLADALRSSSYLLSLFEKGLNRSLEIEAENNRIDIRYRATIKKFTKFI
jgi:hypothetical protein